MEVLNKSQVTAEEYATGTFENVDAKCKRCIDGDCHDDAHPCDYR